MQRAFIVVPNIGLSFGGGRGVKVALYTAQTLLKHELKVHLVALSGWHVVELNRVQSTEVLQGGKGSTKLIWFWGESENTISIRCKVILICLKEISQRALA